MTCGSKVSRFGSIDPLLMRLVDAPRADLGVAPYRERSLVHELARYGIRKVEQPRQRYTVDSLEDRSKPRRPLARSELRR